MRQDLSEKLEAIASHLLGTWVPDPEKDEGFLYPVWWIPTELKVTEKELAKLESSVPKVKVMRAGTGDMVVFRAVYPNGSTGVEVVRINMVGEPRSKGWAGLLSRNLVKDYLETKWPAAVLEAIKWQRFFEGIDGAWARVMATEMAWGDGETRKLTNLKWGAYGTVRVTGPNTVDLHLRGIPVDWAVGLLGLVKKERGEGDESSTIS